MNWEKTYEALSQQRTACDQEISQLKNKTTAKEEDSKLLTKVIAAGCGESEGVLVKVRRNARAKQKDWTASFYGYDRLLGVGDSPEEAMRALWQGLLAKEETTK